MVLISKWTDGREYCLLHIPDNQKNIDERFNRLVKERIVSGNLDFRGTYFPESFMTITALHGVIKGELNFRFAVFNRTALFFNEFEENINFSNCEFRDGAQFNSTKIHKHLLFYEALLDGYFSFSAIELSKTGGISFNLANIAKTSQIRFGIREKFDGHISFDSTTVSGGIAFDGIPSIVGQAISNFSLSMLDASIESPEKVKFRECLLDPEWFQGVDSRKFTFSNVIWMKHKIDVAKPVLIITFRQLAQNAENNNRFEEASNFRRVAFECERLERKEKISNWLSEPVNCSTIFERTKEKIKLFPFDFFHWAYRWTSGYGENRLWAFFVLFLIIFISSAFYATPLCEFPNNHGGVRSLDFIEAISYSLRVMVLQRPEPFPINTFGKVVLAVETALAPLQAALLALAIRRKFMR